jgi:general secretion pathway protein G
MIVSLNRRLATRNRSAFTLLEVLVVVAILVILASVAGIYVFGFLADAKVDTAQNTIAMMETQCKAYMAKNGGDPPQQLSELVQPTNGKSPLIDGGISALNNPWGGQYMMEIGQDGQGNPDPIVYTQTDKGQTLYSKKRQMQGR